MQLELSDYTYVKGHEVLKFLQKEIENICLELNIC